MEEPRRLIETLGNTPAQAPGYWIATTGANVYQFNAPAYSTSAATGTVGGTLTTLAGHR